MSIEMASTPSEMFNFAGHLIKRNDERPNKTAYIDDHGSISYGELADKIQRMASVLQTVGVHREERVLLLMHDCNDWAAAFLGAMYAGIVPVAVNTLLTADDYLYMLQHSRARAALVSNALLPTLQEAMNRGEHEIQSIIVSQADEALPENSGHGHQLAASDAAHCISSNQP